MKKQIKTMNAPQAIGPYSQAVQIDNLLFLSGQIPLDTEGRIISDDIKDQVNQCLTNIDNILKEAGLTKEKIVKTTIFLKDMKDFNLVNEVYEKYFNVSVFPARSTVEVARLPKDVKVEIEAIAVK